MKGHAVTNPFAAPAPQQHAPAEPTPAAAPSNPFGPGVAQQAEPAPATQQYAAPQYAPPAPAPQQYAPAQQGYAPAPQAAPQQYAPAAPQGYAGPALDMSTLAAAPPPPPSGSGTGAKLADMYDRLVLVFPHSIETVQRTERFITPEQRAKGQLTEERVTATVVVLDMGPGTSPAGAFIDFGGAPYELPPKPHTTREPLPYVRKAMWITQSKLVQQLKSFLPANTGGTQGMAAGRVVKQGNDRNAPWYLAGASEDELALCRAYMGLVAQGQYPHPLA